MQVFVKPTTKINRLPPSHPERLSQWDMEQKKSPIGPFPKHSGKKVRKIRKHPTTLFRRTWGWASNSRPSKVGMNKYRLYSIYEICQDLMHCGVKSIVFYNWNVGEWGDGLDNVMCRAGENTVPEFLCYRLDTTKISSQFYSVVEC